MTCRELTSIDEASINEFLSRDSSASFLLLNNLHNAGIKNTENNHINTANDGDYIGYFNDNQLVSLIVHHHNGIIEIHANDHYKTLLSLLLKISQRPVKGIVGPSQAAQEIYKLLFIDNSNIQLNDDSIIYSLSTEKLIMPPNLNSDDYLVRKLELHDLNTYCHWMTKYSIETLRQKKDAILQTKLKKAAQLSIEAKTCWVLEYQGNLVSTCHETTKTNTAISFNTIWTPLEYRSREFARTILAAAIIHNWSTKIPKAFLFANHRNHAAQHCYQSLGFKASKGRYRFILCKKAILFQL